jgi:hypothetical protein
MGMARLAQFDGELAERAINAINCGQSAMDKAPVLIVLVSFVVGWSSNTDGE